MDDLRVDTSAMDYLKQLPEGDGLQQLIEFVHSFDDPEAVANEIRDLLESDDPYVAPPDRFTRHPGEQLFENWDDPVNAYTIFEEEKARLLCLPPGSNRFKTYRDMMPRIMDRHLQTKFPRLKSELANRPNMFFSGVFYPQEIHIDNMEMISLNHGRNYVVRADVQLENHETPETIVLKPASMGVEAVITSTLSELNRRMPTDLKNDVGPIRVPSIVAVDDRYGILEYIPGRNGVEVLPHGINTGTIHTLRNNEFPEQFDISPEGLLELSDEFAKQAALAYYLRLYDRKPDQLLLEPREQGKYRISHIDFGRSLKKNFALPWKRHYATQRAPLLFEDHQIPYFEAAASLIFLPHFIPRDMKDRFPPYEGTLKNRMRRSFLRYTEFLRKNVDVIQEYFQYLVGEKTQFDEKEVHNQRIQTDDIHEVTNCLLSQDPSPEEVFETVFNMAVREREGSTSTTTDSGDLEDSIYHRSLRPGGSPRKLSNRADGERPYLMKDYNEGGYFRYDPNRQIFEIQFGEQPRRVIEHIRKTSSPRLAQFIDEFDSIRPGTHVTIYPNGESTVRIPPNAVRRDVTFPTRALQQVRQVKSGFAPTHHVQNYIDSFLSWKKDHPKVDFFREETEKQTLVFARNLEGKEVLQCYLQTHQPDESVHPALAEIINHMLSDPAYLADKDPIKSINHLVVSLGQKYQLIDRLSGTDIPELPSLRDLFEDCFRFYNQEIPTEHYRDNPSPHLVHVRTMLRLASFFMEDLDLDDEQRQRFMAAVVLHDLSLLDPEFCQLLMDPNGRLNRPIIQDYLARHTELAVDQWDELIEQEELSLPPSLETEPLRDLLENHHELDDPDSDTADPLLHQILHLVDNLSVFSDQTRPDYWNQGYLRLSDLGPHWVRSQFEQDRIDREVYESARRLLSEENGSMLRRIDRESSSFPELYNALQMAAALHYGLDPQNPSLLNDLRDRHGKQTVDLIWKRVLRSYLPVDEKIRIIRRLDELAPFFARNLDERYAFINASPQPVQRAVELIRHHLTLDRTVILVGVFPRVTKTYLRFVDHYGDELADSRDRIVVLSGVRRLQFIRHSYPYEADFEKPFHRIIRDYRQEHGLTENICMIPFERFHQHYSPTEKAATRIRQLEKVSELEEISVPSQVQEEASRYRRWKKEQPPYGVDTLENERFRRILLNNFTNRQVLYFYYSTIDERPNVQIALREVIGALRENPNYLSERSSRYSLHELVRSLSQIHFFSGNQPLAQSILSEQLAKHDVQHEKPYRQILNRLGPEMNFAKNTHSTALQILEYLSQPFDDLDYEAMMFATLGCSIVNEESCLRDYQLSPEDISYNRAVRRRVISHSVPMARMLSETPALRSLPEATRHTVESIMHKARPPLEYALVQVSIYLSFYIDYSRVENWERGRRKLNRGDLRHILPPLEHMLPRHVPRSVADTTIHRVKSFLHDGGVETLNRLSRPTYSYVYLFNVLTLASDLRYGLFPDGLNTFQNVRLLYGVNRTNKLIRGIVESDLSVHEAVKICRKIRSLAAALQNHEEDPGSVHFINMDRSGTWRLPEVDLEQNPMFLLSGELRNTLKFWDELHDHNPEALSYCYCLVGEEFPLFIKETSLSYSDYLKRTITNYRRERQEVGRYMLMPARQLFDEAPPRPEPVLTSYRNAPAGLFFNSWLALFDL